MNVRRRFFWRCAAVPVVAAVLVGVSASPAFAHATLEQTSPAAGQVLDQPPKKLTLGFNESVEVALGAIRVYNSKGDRLEIGDASHPSGQQSQVQVDVPKLDDDSYVVTWRVISADSHPVSGAFTFQVGKSAAAGNLQSLSQRLLANQGGDNLVGFLYAVARFGVFASLALLRPIARRHVRLPAISRTGTDALVGSKAIVLRRVDVDGGRVRIGGEEWSARAYLEDQVLEEGARVDVVKIEGATALVVE